MKGSSDTGEYISSLMLPYLWSNIEPSLAICEAIRVEVIVDTGLLRESRYLFQSWAALPIKLVGYLVNSLMQYFEALLPNVDWLNNFKPPCKISVADFNFPNLVGHC